MKIPKTIGGCADALYQLREKRLEEQKKVDDIQAQETELKNHIIAMLPKSELTGARGKVASVSISTKSVPTVKDWDLVWGYIKKNNAFDMVQRRLNNSAVEARWENGRDVPGVEKFDVVTVSCTKLGAK